MGGRVIPKLVEPHSEVLHASFPGALGSNDGTSAVVALGVVLDVAGEVEVLAVLEREIAGLAEVQALDLLQDGALGGVHLVVLGLVPVVLALEPILASAGDDVVVVGPRSRAGGGAVRGIARERTARGGRRSVGPSVGSAGTSSKPRSAGSPPEDQDCARSPPLAAARRWSGVMDTSSSAIAHRGAREEDMPGYSSSSSNIASAKSSSRPRARVHAEDARRREGADARPAPRAGAAAFRTREGTRAGESRPSPASAAAERREPRSRSR